MKKETIEAKISDIDTNIKNLNESITQTQNNLTNLTANLHGHIGAKQVLVQLLEDSKEEKEESAAK